MLTYYFTVYIDLLPIVRCVQHTLYSMRLGIRIRWVVLVAVFFMHLFVCFISTNNYKNEAIQRIGVEGNDGNGTIASRGASLYLSVDSSK